MTPAVTGRRRQRIRSMNFATLGWLIKREAYFQLVAGDVPYSNEPVWRRFVAQIDGRKLRQLAHRRLRRAGAPSGGA